jgi:GT2 family glycosyltransferase
MKSLVVVVVAYRTRDLTLAAVASVYESDDLLEKTVVVVDNAPGDGTREALAERFPNVDYVAADRNLGFAKACNLGARRANSDGILLLNSDAVLAPDALAIAVAYMRANPRCAVLGARLQNPDGSPQNAIAPRPTLATELLNKSLLRRLFPDRYPGKETTFDAPIEVDTVIGAFLLTTREAFEKAAGLDERFFFFLEETDYCVRLKGLGYAIVHHPSVRVAHKLGASAKKNEVGARIEYWRSRDRYFRKHASFGVVAILRTCLFVRLIVDWALNALGSLATLGKAGGARRRERVCRGILLWILMGAPTAGGLPRESPPPVGT